MTREVAINTDWYFIEADSPYVDFDDHKWKRIELPHSPSVFYPSYRDEKTHQRTWVYRKTFEIELESDQEVVLRFEGIANRACFYLDGREVGSHYGAYVPCELQVGRKENFTLTVLVDSSEDPSIPPFGGSMDYIGFCGIYRSATLVLRHSAHLGGVRVVCQDSERVRVSGSAFNADGLSVTVGLYDEQTLVQQLNSTVTDGSFELCFESLSLQRWDVPHPKLYHVQVELADKDRRTVRFGCRSARFEPDGFSLNGEKVHLVGLNRHQDWPYLGYAASASLQREDARLLKELGLNIVRTSHYPQDGSFLDACDELGLLVFEEIPGWQYIGRDETWRNRCLENVRMMIERDANHPSIVLWGVRINESPDDHELYERANKLARILDPTRQTGGVRNLLHSEFLEDVYTYNDFSYGGKGRGLLAKRKVCKKDSPYLVTEYCGHMYPAKRYDCTEVTVELAMRHYRILDAAHSTKGLSGSIGWCMHDYFTHANFGSGDQICYHGVLDLERNPKAAAFVYLSQLKDEPVLCVLSAMDGGDLPKGFLERAVVATNCQTVRLYYNDQLVGEFEPDFKAFPHLKHPPVIIEDFIGDRLKSESYLSDRQRRSLARLLAKVGKQAGRLTFVDTLRMGLFLLRYHKTYEAAVNLFVTYVGNWGSKLASWRFEGLIDGKVVASETIEAGTAPMMDLLPSATTLLSDGPTYDTAAIRIQVRQKGRVLVLPYAMIAYTVEVEGPVVLASPATDCTIGGSGVIYVRTCGEKGDARVTVHSVLGDTTVRVIVS